MLDMVGDIIDVLSSSPLVILFIFFIFYNQQFITRDAVVAAPLLSLIPPSCMVAPNRELANKYIVSYY